MPFRLLTPFASLSFARRNVQPPGALYVSPQESIGITTITSHPSTSVQLAFRHLGPDGQLIRHLQVETTLPTRTAKLTRYPLAEGWLLGGFVAAVAGDVQPGQLYVTVALYTGLGAAATVSQILWAGYVTATLPSGWPNLPSNPPGWGPSNIRSIVGTDPAAGVEIFETVPTGARWRLLGVDAQLVTSAVAGTREARLTILAPGFQGYFRGAPVAGQGPSTTLAYNWTAVGYVNSVGGVTLFTMGLPDPLILNAGWNITISTPAMDAADNWGPPTLTVEEWVTG